MAASASPIGDAEATGASNATARAVLATLTSARPTSLRSRPTCPFTQPPSRRRCRNLWPCSYPANSAKGWYPQPGLPTWFVFVLLSRAGITLLQRTNNTKSNGKFYENGDRSDVELMQDHMKIAQSTCVKRMRRRYARPSFDREST